MFARPQLVTLVRGRATRHPEGGNKVHEILALSNLWFPGSWLVAGPPERDSKLLVHDEKVLGSAYTSDDPSRLATLVNCISDGPCKLEVRITRAKLPLAQSEGAMIGVKLYIPPGDTKPTLIGELIDPSDARDLLAQTVGITAETVDEARFNAAVLGRADEVTLLLNVQIVDRNFDPFETESDLRFPYAIVMKDVTDPRLLAEASCSTVAALRQAATRAAAMTDGTSTDSPTKSPPKTAAGEALRSFKELEKELDGGVWPDEKPTSQEEVEVKALLSAHFVVKLFHVERPSGRKSVYLLQMKPAALKRETLKFYRDRWKNEGKRAVSGADGVQFFDFAELAYFIKQDKLGPVTPAERLELYERLVRKLFHAKSLGYATLSEGELDVSDQKTGELSDSELEAQLEEQLHHQQQFTPPSFIVYPSSQPDSCSPAPNGGNELGKALDWAAQLTAPKKDAEKTLAAQPLPPSVQSLKNEEKADLERAVVEKVPDKKARRLSAIRREREASKEAGTFVELIEVAFPRHLPEFNHWIEDKLSKTHELSHQDLTIVRNHFGEELALYMSFMNKYSQTLLPFALLGIAMYLLCSLLPGTFSLNYTYLAPFYVTAMVVFSALLQCRWKQENQKLAYLWGVTEYEPADYVRPEFKGERVYNPVKEAYEYEYPAWKRTLKKKPLSYFVISLMVLLLVVISFALYVQLQDSLENPNPAYDYAVLGLVPVRVLLGTGLNASVYGVVVMVGLLTAFQKVANWLCTLENYRTDKEFQDQWVLKMFFL